jgi:hypothetical protein
MKGDKRVEGTSYSLSSLPLTSVVIYPLATRLIKKERRLLGYLY